MKKGKVDTAVKKTHQHRKTLIKLSFNEFNLRQLKRNGLSTLKFFPGKAVVYQVYSDGDTNNVFVQNKKVLRLQYTAESRFLSSLFGRSHKDYERSMHYYGLSCHHKI